MEGGHLELYLVPVDGSVTLHLLVVSLVLQNISNSTVIHGSLGLEKFWFISFGGDLKIREL
jgi:hypothetical protein